METDMEQMIAQIRPAIDALLQRQERVTVAIDGNCGAGKTTLAGRLGQLYNCNVFHMDDFFLRPEQRTPQRYAETGGNVDYERFRQEVLIPLKSGGAFSYRPFDCKSLTFSAPVAVMPKRLTIIEGSYSLHPYFEDPYDLKILLTVSTEVQKERILRRPVHLRDAFFARWIPMENRYLTHFRISETCDLIF